MKKANILGLFSLLMVLMMGLTFTSCDKDDDDDNTSASIVGQWKLIAYEDSTDDDEYEIESVQAMLASGFVFTFNSDGTCSSYAGGQTSTGKYEQKENTLTLIFSGGINSVYTIKKLTSSELVWESVDEEDGCVSTFTFSKK